MKVSRLLLAALLTWTTTVTAQPVATPLLQRSFGGNKYLTVRLDALTLTALYDLYSGQTPVVDSIFGFRDYPFADATLVRMSRSGNEFERADAAKLVRSQLKTLEGALAPADHVALEVPSSGNASMSYELSDYDFDANTFKLTFRSPSVEKKGSATMPWYCSGKQVAAKDSKDGPYPYCIRFENLLNTGLINISEEEARLLKDHVSDLQIGLFARIEKKVYDPAPPGMRGPSPRNAYSNARIEAVYAINHTTKRFLLLDYSGIAVMDAPAATEAAVAPPKTTAPAKAVTTQKAAPPASEVVSEQVPVKTGDSARTVSSAPDLPTTPKGKEAVQPAVGGKRAPTRTLAGAAKAAAGEPLVLDLSKP
jgi:hypothetical protein